MIKSKLKTNWRQVKQDLYGKTALELLQDEAEENDHDQTNSLGKRDIKISSITLDRPVKKPKMTIDLKEGLLEGVSMVKLEEKYKKRKIFNTEDISKLMEDDDDDETTKALQINAMNDNRTLFDQDKQEDIEKEIPEEKKELVGWGDWTGAGIAEKVKDEKGELEKKKQQIVVSTNFRCS